MAKLFADEDFPLPVVLELRRRGHDAVTVFECGLANQRWPDDQVFAHAQKEARVVLTHNRNHFKRLHRQGLTFGAGRFIVPPNEGGRENKSSLLGKQSLLV